MSNRSDREVAGALAGAIAALCTSQAKSPWEALLHAAVGAAGGFAGSGFADAMKPATSPNHRSLCHGLAANGLAAYAGLPALLRWRLETTGDENTNEASRLASAAAVGAAAGHASHLALDATTPRGLPVLW